MTTNSFRKYKSIGDNPSFLSDKSIVMSGEEKQHFIVCLQCNSTHLCQLLDCALFCPIQRKPGVKN